MELVPGLKFMAWSRRREWIFFSLPPADVVPHPSTFFAEGQGPFHFSDTLCAGNEDRLLSCVYDPDVTSCSHDQDEAGVTCYNNSPWDSRKMTWLLSKLST